MAIKVSSAYFYIGTDQRIRLVGLVDEAGAFINDATVTADLFDAKGLKLSDSPIVMEHVPGSDGDYDGTLPHNVSPMAPNSQPYLIITAAKNGVQCQIKLQRTAQYLTA